MFNFYLMISLVTLCDLISVFLLENKEITIDHYWKTKVVIKCQIFIEPNGVVINNNSRNLPACCLGYLAPLPIIDYWTTQPTREQQSHWKYYIISTENINYLNRKYFSSKS